jgi:hypothetical protein
MPAWPWDENFAVTDRKADRAREQKCCTAKGQTDFG